MENSWLISWFEGYGLDDLNFWDLESFLYEIGKGEALLWEFRKDNLVGFWNELSSTKFWFDLWGINLEYVCNKLKFSLIITKLHHKILLQARLSKSRRLLKANLNKTQYTESIWTLSPQVLKLDLSLRSLLSELVMRGEIFGLSKQKPWKNIIEFEIDKNLKFLRVSN